MIPTNLQGHQQSETRVTACVASVPHPISAQADAPVSDYLPPRWLRNGHLQSVWPTLFRKVSLSGPEVEIIRTSDNDELHLDWYRQGSDRLAVLSHGLEGHSRRPYMLGMTGALLADGWDVLAWNFRSCGGVMNHQPRFYHSGSTEDLARVIGYGLGEGDSGDNYRTAALAGFSMGGNLTLLYLGQQNRDLDPRIAGAVTFSVPCDLAGSAGMLARPSRRIYMKRFLRDLQVKMTEKARLFPELIDVTDFESIRNFRQFDDRFTAPLHGFRDAEDYWARCSALGQLKDIQVPALIVNALDDPFLSSGCFPEGSETLGHHVRLEAPRWGGHVGFVATGSDGYYWSERRAVRFLGDLAGA